jgi:transposase InsO family protein
LRNKGKRKGPTQQYARKAFYPVLFVCLQPVGRSHHSPTWIWSLFLLPLLYFGKSKDLTLFSEDLTLFSGFDEARGDVLSYIKYYNFERGHSYNNYLSPVQAERIAN